MASLANINIKFLADLKDFSTKMQTSERQIKKMGKSLQKVGKTMSIGITAPIVALGTIAVKTFAKFEQEMAKVKAISGATATEFKALTDSAKDLGSSTRFTASQVAALQLNFSKLGFDPREIQAVTAATLDLALATGEDLAESATVAASTLRGFELAASDMQRVVDVMAKSFSSSALDLEKFKTSMSALAPVAKNAGVSIERATGYLSILVDRGVDASTAGTGLRNMFLDLTKHGLTLEEALNKINTSSDKNATALQLFGKRGATVSLIMAANVGPAEDLTKAYLNSAGAAEEMAAIMDDTLQGSLFKLKSAAEGLAIAFGDELKGKVEAAAGYLADMANAIKDLDPEVKKVVISVGGFLAIIGPLLVALGFLMTNIIPGLITVFSYLSATVIPAVTSALSSLWVAMLANPITATIALLGALGLTFYNLSQEIFHNVGVMETFWNMLKSGGNFNAFLNYQSVSNAKNTAKLATEWEGVVGHIEKYSKKLDEVIKKTGELAGLKAIRPFASDQNIDTRGTKGIEDISAGGFQESVNPDANFGPTDYEVEMMEERIQRMINAQERLQEVAGTVGDGVASAFADMANSFLDSLGIADTAFGSFVKSLGRTVIQIIARLLAQSIATAIAGAQSSAAATGPGYIATGPAFTAAAVGLVGASFGAIPAFADGGIIYGPTVGLFGEYADAATNPEVVAPLDKLKSLIGPSQGVTDINLHGAFEIDGRKLRLVLDKSDKYYNRIGG